MPQAAADVIQHLSELPPFPKVTSRLLLVLEDPTVSVDQLADLVASDPSLVVKVIHLANSPFYMTSRAIESVSDAVFVLGISTIKSITTAISIHKGMATLKPHPGTFSMDAFWKHSYGTAIVASKMAAKRSRQLSDRLYLAGMIQDIGKLVQACFWPETWRSAINQVKSAGTTLACVEKSLFGQGNAEITATLCDAWGFPEPVVALLRPSGEDLEEDEDTRAGREILVLAERLAAESNLPFPPEETLEPWDDDVSNYSEFVANLEDEVGYRLDILGK